MPWSDFDPSVRQFSGLIQFAAANRYGVFQTNALLKLSADAAGLSTSFQTYSSASKLYGSFSRVNRGIAEFAQAFRTFQATGQDQGITDAMISQPPWAPSPGDWNVLQKVSVRAEFQVETPEGPLTSWFTLDKTRQQLTTVGALTADLQLEIDTSGTESPPMDATLTGNVEITWTL